MPEGLQHTSPGQSGAALAAKRRPGCRSEISVALKERNKRRNAIRAQFCLALSERPFFANHVTQGCAVQTEAAFSQPLTLATGPVWGDLVGNDGEAPPDGDADVLDVAAVVDAIMEVPGSLDVPQADLFPEQTDLVVNVLEVSSVVDAVLGAGYPFDGPPGCP